MIRLTNYERKEFEAQNQARLELGMPLLVISERPCMQCRQIFETISKRRCKTCRATTSGYASLSGHDVVETTNSVSPGAIGDGADIPVGNQFNKFSE